MMAQLLCFGLGLRIGAYYVQAQESPGGVFGGPFPLESCSSMYYQSTRFPIMRRPKGRETELVARFGRGKGVWLFILSLFLAYGVIVAGVILGRIPILGLISLLTLRLLTKPFPS